MLNSNKSIPNGPNSTLLPAIKDLHVLQGNSRAEASGGRRVNLIMHLLLIVKKTYTCTSTVAVAEIHQIIKTMHPGYTDTWAHTEK